MELTQEEFNNLRGYIHELCGLAIPDNKEYLITRRLGPLLDDIDVCSWTEFHDHLRDEATPQMRSDVISAITTNETSFFRDSHPFTAFREHLLPQLADVFRKRRKSKGPVRIWSAAASTGQEAYTLAMLIHDFVNSEEGADLSPSNFSILGTDISPRVLLKAEQGEYSHFELSRGLPEGFLQFFDRCGESWSVCSTLRKLVNFRQFNLVTGNFAELGLFDLILCRNVLIYFDEDTKRALLQRLQRSLRPGSYLMLGSTESIYGLNTDFKQHRLGKSLMYCVEKS